MIKMETQLQDALDEYCKNCDGGGCNDCRGRCISKLTININDIDYSKVEITEKLVQLLIFFNINKVILSNLIDRLNIDNYSFFIKAVFEFSDAEMIKKILTKDIFRNIIVDLFKIIGTRDIVFQDKYEIMKILLDKKVGFSSDILDACEEFDSDVNNVESFKKLFLQC
jgi:hypothetical protein